MTTPSHRRRIAVTGAASGIGAALAARLVASGSDVFGIDRSTSGVPDGVEAIACDLTDPGEVAGAVTVIRDRVGPAGLAGVAAVAGVPGSAPPSTVYAVNIVGLRRVVAATTPLLASGGAVVLVSSMAGYRGPATPDEMAGYLASDDDDLQARLEDTGLDGPGAYQLSKQLVHHLAVDLAARLHPSGIRALSLSPGPVETPILDDFRSTMPTVDEASRLVGRNARPDEVAAVAEFALSPAASWLNGIDIRLDGGLGALRARTAPAG